MRLVEERSLSSIFRSNLLTTLINNDVSGKVNASGCANALDKFHTMQKSFGRLRSESAEKKTVSEKKNLTSCRRKAALSRQRPRVRVPSTPPFF